MIVHVPCARFTFMHIHKEYLTEYIAVGKEKRRECPVICILTGICKWIVK